MLSELAKNGLILVSAEDIKCFTTFCRIHGVFPCGGELVNINGQLSQYFYL
jgi:hypothetical protein